MNKTTLRENLLVTFGCRAGAMDALGHIALPSGSAGEDALADFANYIVTLYMEQDEIGFDEFIETALLTRYGKEN